MTHNDPAQWNWRKSSHSPDGGGNCVEVGWRKSSYSPDGGKSCLEARRTPDAARVAFRDSQHRSDGYLVFPSTEWTAFLRAASRDEL